MISTTKHISHPACKYHYINGSYLFFDLVANLVLSTDPFDDKVNINWMTINIKMVHFIDVQTGMMSCDKDRE